jgi:hypothetical protein
MTAAVQGIGICNGPSGVVLTGQTGLPFTPAPISRLCTDSFGRFRLTVDLGEDGLGCFGPHERMRLFVVLGA